VHRTDDQAHGSQADPGEQHQPQTLFPVMTLLLTGNLPGLSYRYWPSLSVFTWKDVFKAVG
jgi:hypothetical protein